ncbi:MAG: hypothetical protein ACXWP5_07275 [Bdellovibrionota bacterium]
MSENQETVKVETADIEQTINASAQSTPIALDDSEFKVTVRKLEMPVRPRGVLAE